ncbi:hypothetical protein [Hyphomicrobium sp. D-2]|nr:hypothetical protein [Hyphomicrobium sp. D-2]MDH4983228.1 hypothetical protein [Hyphomicrobium sp. D-2]
MPKSTVRVTGGAKSRIKSLTISGKRIAWSSGLGQNSRPAAEDAP